MQKLLPLLIGLFILVGCTQTIIKEVPVVTPNPTTNTNNTTTLKFYAGTWVSQSGTGTRHYCTLEITVGSTQINNETQCDGRLLHSQKVTRGTSFSIKATAPNNWILVADTQVSVTGTGRTLTSTGKRSASLSGTF